MSESKSFENKLAEWLEVLDKHLSERSVPIPTRTLAAARLFVEHAILEIEGDTTDDFLNRPWFKKLHTAVDNWYSQKYGAAAIRADKWHQGVVLFSGVPFGLQIPITLSRVETPGETAWLTFPADVQADENPLKWMERPPNFEQMKEDDLGALRTQITEIGTNLRRIWIDLSSCQKPDHESAALANKVMPHLQSAAGHIMNHSSSSLGLAAWEAHQAAESVMKLRSRQLLGSHAHTHDLNMLCGQLDLSAGVIPNLVRMLPNAKRVVEMRAGEGSKLDIAGAFNIYSSALLTTRHLAVMLDRNKIRFHNSSFLLRKAPWLD